jgi:GTPase
MEEEQQLAPSGIVAIVGRPNVGKSSLFNRLVGGRSAIVDPMAGLTRDRLYGICEWAGRNFTVVDTAGLDPSLEKDDVSKAVLTRGTQTQARYAIAEADVCVFVLSVRDGVTGLDEDVAAILRTSRKPVILVGNKADGGAEHYATELHRLGLGEPRLISAIQGRDTGDLLDAIVESLPPTGESAAAVQDELSIAIIGRPNVGKSSILNAIVGDERALVSPLAGTTRDTVDTVVEIEGKWIRLVDTAGIRRRGAISDNVEHYSLLRSLRALERSDIAILVMDASEGVVAQDRHVAGYAIDCGAGLVVAANKWDLVDQEERARPVFLKKLRRGFEFVPGSPLVAVSAKDKRNISKLIDATLLVARNRAHRIRTSELNNLISDAMADHPPRFHKGRRLKVLYVTQAESKIPTIVLFVNDPALMHFSYARYLENRIRDKHDFSGVRLKIVARKRGESKE